MPYDDPNGKLANPTRAEIFGSLQVEDGDTGRALPDGPLRIASELRDVASLKSVVIASDALDVGVIERLSRLELTTLDLCSYPLSDAALAPIGRMRQLKSLSLSSPPLISPQISERGISGLVGLPALESLSLSGASVADDVLSRLPTLKSLDLSSCKLTAQTFRGLSNRSNLDRLRLSSVPITAEIAAQIGLLQSVVELDISNTDLSDERFRILCAGKKLRSLKLCSVTGVTLGGLSAVPSNAITELTLDDVSDVGPGLVDWVAGLPLLQKLTVTKQQFAPDEVNILAQLRGLTYLDLPDCDLIVEQQTAFQANLPWARIHAKNWLRSGRQIGCP